MVRYNYENLKKLKLYLENINREIASIRRYSSNSHSHNQEGHPVIDVGSLMSYIEDMEEGLKALEQDIQEMIKDEEKIK